MKLDADGPLQKPCPIHSGELLNPNKHKAQPGNLKIGNVNNLAFGDEDDSEDEWYLKELGIFIASKISSSNNY